MLSTDLRLSLGNASWLHLATIPGKPGSWGIGRAELTDTFHQGCITQAVDRIRGLGLRMGLDLHSERVTRVDMSVNLPGDHVPELAPLIYTHLRGNLSRTRWKKVEGDPPSTIYVGNYQDDDGPGYSYCIYNKVLELQVLWQKGKITEEEFYLRLQRYDEFRGSGNVTRYELRQKGPALAKFASVAKCRTIEGLTRGAQDIFIQRSTDSLEFTAEPLDKANRNAARATVHHHWQAMRDGASRVMWDFCDQQRPVHRVYKERLAMNKSERINRIKRALVKELREVEGPDFDHLVDIQAACHELLDSESWDDIDPRKVLHEARQKLGTPERLQELGIPHVMPEVDETGRMIEPGRVVHAKKTLPPGIRREARERVADLFSGLPF